MKRKKDNSLWFNFFLTLMGYRVYKNNVEIPKYILFHKGLDVNKIKANQYPGLSLKPRI